MIIYLRTCTGKDITIDDDKLGFESTIEEVNTWIGNKMGHLPACNLIFAGKQLLAQGRTLASYGISNESTIHQVLRLRGGGFKFADPRKPMLSIEYTTRKDENSIMVRDGLNLEVKCACTGQHHYVSKGMGKFELGSELDVVCPKCDKPTTAIGYGFASCYYNWEGQDKDGFTAKGNGEARTQFMTTDSDKKCGWRYLNVETRPLKRKVYLVDANEDNNEA